MKQSISILIITTLILSSCGGAIEQPTVSGESKLPFLVQTYSIGKKTELYTVEKSARLTAGSSLSIAAESLGEVTNIAVREWQKIQKWMKLISLKDTINSYDIRLAQAENALNIEDASIASTKLSLDRAISDTQIAYDQARKSYDLLIAKNNLIYETLLNTNTKTLESYNESYRSYLAGIEASMTNFLYEWDKILGISTNFQYANDAWEPYLGTRVGNSVSESNNEWNKLYGSRGEIRAKKETWGNLSPTSLVKDLQVITEGYVRLEKYIDAMVFMIQNNTIGGGLPQELQNGWLSLWNGIKSQSQGSEAGFNAWKSQTLAFFKNYQDVEKATKIALDSLYRPLSAEESTFLSGSQDARLTYANTRLDTKDRIKSAEYGLKSAELARDNAVKNKALTLNQLLAGRSSTTLSLDQAKREYAKLAILAPFDGTVSKVMASVWERTNMGTPLIQIASNIPEIVTDLDGDIANWLSNGVSVWVKIGGKAYTGTIVGISRTAWTNLLYTTRISVPWALTNIGSAATVIFTISQEKIIPNAGEWIILPLKSVKILSEQEWEIALLSKDNMISFKPVKLGRIVGDGVEIIDRLDPNLEVILSDLSNYDALKYTITKKN